MNNLNTWENPEINFCKAKKNKIGKKIKHDTKVNEVESQANKDSEYYFSKQKWKYCVRYLNMDGLCQLGFWELVRDTEL